MTYKRIIPCIFIKDGKAVKWFDNLEVIDEDPIALAKFYNLIFLTMMKSMMIQSI